MLTQNTEKTDQKKLCILTLLTNAGLQTNNRNLRTVTHALPHSDRKREYTLNKKWIFPPKLSLVDMKNPHYSADLFTFTKEIFTEKLADSDWIRSCIYGCFTQWVCLSHFMPMASSYQRFYDVSRRYGKKVVWHGKIKLITKKYFCELSFRL